jgi:hypothetical protein
LVSVNRINHFFHITGNGRIILKCILKRRGVRTLPFVGFSPTDGAVVLLDKTVVRGEMSFTHVSSFPDDLAENQSQDIQCA